MSLSEISSGLENKHWGADVRTKNKPWGVGGGGAGRANIRVVFSTGGKCPLIDLLIGCVCGGGGGGSGGVQMSWGHMSWNLV